MRRHWAALIAVMAIGFAVIGAFEPKIRSSMPPIPERVLGPQGRTVIDGASIRRGQNVWQSIGGH
jgi:nitric oxide reductase subunit B